MPIELNPRRLENISLGAGQGFVLFSFKSSDAEKFCMNGNLHLRLNMAVFDYKVVTTGTSTDTGDGSSADEAPGGPSSQSPSRNMSEVWNDILAAPRPRPNTPSL